MSLSSKKNHIYPIANFYKYPSNLLYLNIKQQSKTKNQRKKMLKEQYSTTVAASVSVKVAVGGTLSNLMLRKSRRLVDVAKLFGKSILLELVSSELDSKTGLEKKTIKKYACRVSCDEDDIKYECDFVVPEDFGEIGAILVENEHHKEMYLNNITLDGLQDGKLIVNCNSWVASKSDKRVFFTNKSYLPSQTPNGLRRLREKDLVENRGNGQEERKTYDRIYDYDMYNDLGDPDSNIELKRPVLGGKEHPYPRRCRTGRARTKKDPLSETRSRNVYVPRDEAFSDVKNQTFSAKTVYSVLRAVGTFLKTANEDRNFDFFHEIDSSFKEEVNLSKLKNNSGSLGKLKRQTKKVFYNAKRKLLRFKPPAVYKRDRFSWDRDEEFSRQTLAGTNPYSIQLVKEWPLKSQLDPKTYGPPESAITTELVGTEIKSFMTDLTVEEAVKQKKLFMLDYHDLLMPYVSKVRDINWTPLYGSRTLFFLTATGTLRPLAIELTRPPMAGKPQWNQVFTPCRDATGMWLWRLAKTHVLAHDSGYHQLVSHWLRTHCATEPYIIASHRQLSAMHPIFRLLHPHFRYTMAINSLARSALINADGIIETSFSPGKYSMELSSAAYDLQWRFDHEALPADLISRGMAVLDPTAPHGLKLTIEDYPFANDGLILWDAIKQWVTDYVNHYYPDASLVQSDHELQEWWTEIRTVGHGDKKDEPWWPKLKSPEDLIGILTTMIWVASGHHSAVNFGQYAFAGYFPNRPTIARNRMPTEDPSDAEWKCFHDKPEVTLLSCFPTKKQATEVMSALDLLSNHSPDEEYIGVDKKGLWADNPTIKAAFERFSGKLKELEGIIDARNANKSLKNRNGAGVVPYELLKPYSEAGVTGKGVPNSTSI